MKYGKIKRENPINQQIIIQIFNHWGVSAPLFYFNTTTDIRISQKDKT